MIMTNIVRIMVAIAVLTVFAPGARAATPITKEQANAYYAQCVSKRDEGMSVDAQNEFCACKSVHLMQTVSAEDLKVAVGTTPEARVMQRKMMITVDGPCISGPIADITPAQCMNDPRVTLADETLDRGMICGCMTDKIESWLSAKGPDVMTEALALSPMMVDSVTSLMEHTIYESEKYEIMMDCMQSPEALKNKYKLK